GDNVFKLAGTFGNQPSDRTLDLFFCGTYHFPLDGVIQHDPCLLHLWSKRGTKLLLQAPYQCLTERSEMRCLDSEVRVLPSCMTDDGLAYFRSIQRTNNRSDRIHQLELLPFHVVGGTGGEYRARVQRIGRRTAQRACDAMATARRMIS